MQYQTQQRVVRMARTLLEKQMKKKPVGFNSTIETMQYLRLQLEPLEREVFMVLYLDNQHRLITSETTSMGTINATAVYPREIIKTALGHNAAAVVVAHNHPSGVAEPSDDDRKVTKRIFSAPLNSCIRAKVRCLNVASLMCSKACRGTLRQTRLLSLAGKSS